MKHIYLVSQIHHAADSRLDDELGAFIAGKQGDIAERKIKEKTITRMIEVITIKWKKMEGKIKKKKEKKKKRNQTKEAACDGPK